MQALAERDGIFPSKGNRLDKYFARGPADSITASPAAHLNTPYRKTFWDGISEITAAASIQLATHDRRHTGYMRQAAENRERGTLDNWLSGEDGPMFAPSQATAYGEHPDVVIARTALRGINPDGHLHWIADDLIQEACIALQWEPRGDRALRVRVAKHAMIDVLRKEGVRERARTYDDAYALGDDQEPRMTEEQERQRRARPGTLGRDLRYWDAVGALPPRQGRVISLLRYLSTSEVAAEMGITGGALEQLKIRAISNLRKILGVTVGKRPCSNAVVSRGENYGTIGDAA